MFRFLHLGDLHLASPLAAFPPAAAAARRAEQYDVLESALKKAVFSGAEAILFAGDVFDGAAPGRDAVSRFYGILGALPVPVFLAPGNHDFYQPDGLWDSCPLPANVRLFREETLTYFDLPEKNVTVYGFAFRRESATVPPLFRSPELPAGREAVLLCHADLTSPLSAYAPLTAGELENSPFSYAALGHIHNPPEPKKYGATLAAYSGFFSGRGFDECGAGQGRLVTLENGAAETEIFPVGGAEFRVLELDCTGLSSGEEVRARAAALLSDESLPASYALRLKLCGNVGRSCRPDLAALARLGARFALFEVRDLTLPIYDAGYLLKDPSLTGAFYRAMLPRLSSADEETRATAGAAFRMGLAALAGEEIIG